MEGRLDQEPSLTVRRCTTSLLLFLRLRWGVHASSMVPPSASGAQILRECRGSGMRGGLCKPVGSCPKCIARWCGWQGLRAQRPHGCLWPMGLTNEDQWRV